MNDLSSRFKTGAGQMARDFLRDDTGAITIDWVVLTASVVLLGAAAGFIVTANVPGVADEVSQFMSDQPVGETPPVGEN